MAGQPPESSVPATPERRSLLDGAVVALVLLVVLVVTVAWIGLLVTLVDRLMSALV